MTTAWNGPLGTFRLWPMRIRRSLTWLTRQIASQGTPCFRAIVGSSPARSDLDDFDQRVVEVLVGRRSASRSGPRSPCGPRRRRRLGEAPGGERLVQHRPGRDQVPGIGLGLRVSEQLLAGAGGELRDGGGRAARGGRHLCAGRDRPRRRPRRGCPAAAPSAGRVCAAAFAFSAPVGVAVTCGPSIGWDVVCSGSSVCTAVGSKGAAALSALSDAAAGVPGPAASPSPGPPRGW